MNLLNFKNEMCELKATHKGVDFRFIIHEPIDVDDKTLNVDALFRVPNGRLYCQKMKISEEVLNEPKITDMMAEFAYASYERQL